MVAYANEQGSPQVGVLMLGVSTTPIHADTRLLCRLAMLFGWTQACSSSFPFCIPKWVWDIPLTQSFYYAVKPLIVL